MPEPKMLNAPEVKEQLNNNSTLLGLAVSPKEEYIILSCEELKNSSNARVRKLCNNNGYIQPPKSKILQFDIRRQCVSINGQFSSNSSAPDTVKELLMSASFTAEEIELLCLSYTQEFLSLLHESIISAFIQDNQGMPPILNKIFKGNIYKNQDQIYLEGHFSQLKLSFEADNNQLTETEILGNTAVIYILDKERQAFKLLNILVSNAYLKHLLFSDNEISLTQGYNDFIKAQKMQPTKRSEKFCASIIHPASLLPNRVTEKDVSRYSALTMHPASLKSN